MIDLTKPLRTRSGYPVGLISVDTDLTYALLGFVQYPDDKAWCTWTQEGKLLVNSPTEHSLDLINTESNMIDLAKPVQTRNGVPVRLLCTDANSGFPVTGLISQPRGDVVGTWTEEGRYLGESCESPWDLVNVPVRHEGWVNICLSPISEKDLIASNIYATKERADAMAVSYRIACICISFTEGEGL